MLIQEIHDDIHQLKKLVKLSVMELIEIQFPLITCDQILESYSQSLYHLALYQSSLHVVHPFQYLTIKKLL